MVEIWKRCTAWNEHTQETRVVQVSQAKPQRRSLLALGGASLIALLIVPASRPANAKRNRKQQKRGAEACQPTVEDCSSDIFQTCMRQKEECNAFFAPLCADENAPRNCAEATAICCALLGACLPRVLYADHATGQRARMRAKASARTATRMRPLGCTGSSIGKFQGIPGALPG